MLLVRHFISTILGTLCALLQDRKVAMTMAATRCYPSIRLRSFTDHVAADSAIMSPSRHPSPSVTFPLLTPFILPFIHLFLYPLRSFLLIPHCSLSFPLRPIPHSAPTSLSSCIPPFPISFLRPLCLQFESCKDK
jgi:hypothetical protein